MQKKKQSENNKLTEQMRTEKKLAAQFERANQQLSADLTKQIRGEKAKLRAEFELKLEAEIEKV
jgi:hypothetical protein